MYHLSDLYDVVELSYHLQFCYRFLVELLVPVHCRDPIRYLMTILYARHVISKRYLETALENISCEDKGAKEAVASVKSTSLVDEEHKNPKIKSTRIITIKGKHNSSINM